MGMVYTEAIHCQFGRIAQAIGLSHLTAPKTLRHTFATSLQDANVDPLIRNELMGHTPAKSHSRGGGLGMTAVYAHTHARRRSGRSWKGPLPIIPPRRLPRRG